MWSSDEDPITVIDDARTTCGWENYMRLWAPACVAAVEKLRHRIGAKPELCRDDASPDFVTSEMLLLDRVWL